MPATGRERDPGDRERNPALLTGLVALGVASVVTAVAAPPDPFTQLLALPVAVALAAVVAGQWVGFHGGWRVLRARLAGDGPETAET